MRPNLVLLFVKFKKRGKYPYKFTKSNTPQWVFFTIFKLYQPNRAKHHIWFMAISSTSANGETVRSKYSKILEHIQLPTYIFK